VQAAEVTLQASSACGLQIFTLVLGVKELQSLQCTACSNDGAAQAVMGVSGLSAEMCSVTARGVSVCC
jgi:hypothetical protein